MALANLAHFIDLHRQGRKDEAAVGYRLALADEPADFTVLGLLGLIERERKNIELSLRLQRRSTRLNSGSFGAWYNLGVTLHGVNEYEEAENAFAMASQADSKWQEPFYYRGLCLFSLNKMDQAVEAFKAALAFNPSNFYYQIHLGKAYYNTHKNHSAAMKCFKASCAISPDNKLAYEMLSLAFSELGKHDETICQADHALLIDVNDMSSRHLRAIALFGKGKFTDALAEHEFRYRNLQFKSDKPANVIWDGRCVPEGTICIWIEGGYGDAIQFIRFLPKVARRCRHVVLVCPEPLRRLLSTAVDGMSISFNIVAPHAAMAMSFSLPFLLGESVETISSEAYLKADPERVTRWRDRLAAFSGLRVGLCWNNGSEGRGADPRRSVPFDVLKPLTEVPDIQVFSLHRHDSMTAKLVPDSHAKNVHDFGPEMDAGPDAFVDTAALMMSLDLVITIDTAVAHLAGALGRPVWLALAHTADWRWMDDTQTTPWYPSMRLFRQSRAGDWEGVVDRMLQALGAIRTPEPDVA